eukprot:m.57459 g.57459  ORF g.57459 m.57459 type:complete len:664 (+) comp11232_c0_seq4:336-2327(+)
MHFNSISHAQVNALQDFHSSHFEHLEFNWEKVEEAEIRQILGVDLDVASPTLTSMGASSAFSGVMDGLVVAISNNTQFPIVQELIESTRVHNFQDKEEFEDCLRIIGDMLAGSDADTDLRRGYFTSIRENAFRDYLREMKRRSVDKLQSRYNEYIHKHAPFPHEKDVNWRDLFVALRSGNEAMARDNKLYEEKDEAFKTAIDLYFSATAQDSMDCGYQHSPSPGASEFEQGVVALLQGSRGARAIPERLFGTNFEDYVWLKLRTMSDDPKEFISFQRQISVDYGEAHFKASVRPWMYMKCLLFTAQFEKAVAFLQRVDPELAVHVAIPLFYYGALNTTNTIAADVLTEEKVGSFIVFKYNFALLIQRFAHLVMANNRRDALNYLYLLGETRLSDENSRTVFMYNFANIVLEHNDLSLLQTFGEKGKSMQGLMDFVPIQDRSRFLNDVADEFEARGRFVEAIRLHRQAEKQQGELGVDGLRSVGLLLEKLSEVIVMDNYTDRTWSEYLTLAHEFVDDNLDGENPHLDILCTIGLFIDAVHADRSDICISYWEKLSQLHVLPSTADDVQNCVEYRRLSDDVSRTLPSLLFFSMKLCALQLEKITSRRDHRGGVVGEKTKWQKKGRAVLNFTSKLGHTHNAEGTKVLSKLQKLVDICERGVSSRFN